MLYSSVNTHTHTFTKVEQNAAATVNAAFDVHQVPITVGWPMKIQRLPMVFYK